MSKVKVITSFRNAESDHNFSLFNNTYQYHACVEGRGVDFGGSRMKIKADISILAPRLSVFTRILPKDKVCTILYIKCQVKYLNLIIKMLRQSKVIY